ncbi:tetratricopeptide repeat protein [Sphingomonas mucosissima]|uniref:Beta-lactamase HcpA n=1 Tax=Sphingomonas mucosissima TaxID=370959 RepID=A0A245ZLY4_9SPHN|nr:tetratricopeptide repeat protein [Sphingomonas mucosissima]OWK30751.1 beta-lactamase HcpA precursor [Sphingomonas mucosissima]
MRARLSGSPEERASLVRAGAQQGVAEAQAVWGQMLLDEGKPREGFSWFNKAAAQGHLMALNMVGRCYDQGWGVAIDKARAAECFRIAAERGLDWGMYNFATALTLGEGVPEDKAAALAWFEKACALGNAKAINYIGSFHEDGWVVARNMAVAADCYARAAEGGDFRGAFNHARMLIADARYDEAREWLARCAQSATPAFLDKAARWLSDSPRPALAEVLRSAPPIARADG